MLNKIHVIGISVGPEYFGTAPYREDISQIDFFKDWKDSNIPYGMQCITAKTIEELKSELCRLVDYSVDKWTIKKKEEFAKFAVEFKIEITEEQIDKFIEWINLPTNLDEASLSESWYYPTKLSDLLKLASEDNLPPKNIKEFIIWEKQYNYRDNWSKRII